MFAGTGSSMKRVLIALAVVAGPLVVIVTVLVTSGSPKEKVPLPPPVHAIDLSKDTIYHSPQRPGFTSWVGVWAMPGDALMVGFDQATGPVDPDRRTLTPAAISRETGVPRSPDPHRDFWGLTQASIYLRSEDGGATWHRFASYPYRASGSTAYTSQPTIALKDGTIIRRVNGDDLRYDKSIPHTAFLQRLAPGGTHWSKPQVLLDPAKQTYQLTRIKYLHDGRMIATGNSWDVPADTPLAQRNKVPSRFLLMISTDNGKTWKNGLKIPSSVGALPGNEWDTGELPDGNLAAVLRTTENGQPVRKQGLLERDGDGFVLTHVKLAPFPHSGHPELLATRQGPVLHIATTGVSYTRDGLSWHPLRFPGGVHYTSNYYPRAIQTPDDVVHVFGHVGSDDPYGAVDQSITMDSFRLAIGP